MTADEIVKKFREYLKSDKAGTWMTEEEILDDDAEGGYFDDDEDEYE